MPSPASSSPLDALARGILRVLAALFGLLLAFVGLLLMLGMLALGIAAAAGLALWSLLRGRRPTLGSFRWQRASFHRMRPGAARQPRPTATDVVDVDVHEVREIRPPRDA